MDLSKYQGLILILVFLGSKISIMYFGFYTYQDFDAFLDEYGNENTYYEIVNMYKSAKDGLAIVIGLKVTLSFINILIVPVIAAGIQLVLFSTHWFKSFFKAYLYSALLSFLIIFLIKFSWYAFIDPHYTFQDLREFKRIVSVFAFIDPENLHPVSRVLLSYFNLEFLSFFGLLFFSFHRYSNTNWKQSVNIILRSYIPILVTGITLTIIYLM